MKSVQKLFTCGTTGSRYCRILNHARRISSSFYLWTWHAISQHWQELTFISEFLISLHKLNCLEIFLFIHRIQEKFVRYQKTLQHSISLKPKDLYTPLSIEKCKAHKKGSRSRREVSNVPEKRDFFLFFIPIC